MNQSNKSEEEQPEFDYAKYGLKVSEPPKEKSKDPVQEAQSIEGASQQKEEQPEFDYAKYGLKEAKPPKEKIGVFKSALQGSYKSIAGVAALGEAASNVGVPNSKNHLMEHLADLPEPEGPLARLAEAGAGGATIGAAWGPIGAGVGLVGSLAGQAVREIWGEEGKAEGWTEGAAIGTDILFSGGAGVISALDRAAVRTAAQEAPNLFRQAEGTLAKKSVKIALGQEKTALQDVVNNFSRNQIQGFEEAAIAHSPRTYSQITEAGLSESQRAMNQSARNGYLFTISPLEATPAQAGTAMQEAANTVFRTEVLAGERAAYTAAKESAEGLRGYAPRTVADAKALRSELSRGTPTGDQESAVQYLDDLIASLENQEGLRERSANALVDIVQQGNQVVDYGSQVRKQSHRLMPILRTLREETGAVIGQRPEASRLFQEANLDHARNAQVWGTNYMKNVRFTQSPENLISGTKKASSMRNFKQAVRDPVIQGAMERSVVGQITESGGAEANRVAIRNLSPELSPTARGAAEQLSNLKDPVTSVGGRAAARNDIIKQAAQAVNTKKPPTQILNQMKTLDGYNLVRESLNGSAQSRELFQSFERLFMEDIVKSVTNDLGQIDFKKARNIFKDTNMRAVVERMNPNMLRRFEQLERYSNNFSRNVDLYSKPEVQAVVSKFAEGVKNTGAVAAIFSALHIPYATLAGLGLGAVKLTTATYGFIERKLLSNPRAMHYLEQLSLARTASEVAKQLPRLVAALETKKESKKDN